ncbi:hypothetical protein Tco_1574054, partial [Tanacetum coccineum]
MGVLSILDREDLKAVYELVMEKYQDEIPEGFDKVLWGDLLIMFNQETEEESTMALELIKFVKQQLEDFKDSDDDARFDHDEEER